MENAIYKRHIESNNHTVKTMFNVVKGTIEYSKTPWLQLKLILLTIQTYDWGFYSITYCLVSKLLVIKSESVVNPINILLLIYIIYKGFEVFAIHSQTVQKIQL